MSVTYHYTVQLLCPKCNEHLTPGDDGLYCECCGHYIMAFDKIERETGLIEWMCPHGVGHPDERSADYLASYHGRDPDTYRTHGCDGCCNRDDFPGSYCTEESIK